MHIRLTPQVITVHLTSSPVIKEGVFMILKGAMTMMTVEITVMKMDVSHGRWEATNFLQSCDITTVCVE